MIAIGSDHGGFELKKKLMEHLSERGLEYKDFGTYSSASCDYPVYAKAVARTTLVEPMMTCLPMCTGLLITCLFLSGIMGLVSVVPE